MAQEENTSFGVFKPVDHVVISLPDAQSADRAAQAIGQIGVQAGAIRRFTDQEMISQIDHDMQSASPLASIGQEMNLIRAHRELAERGFHWLVVRAEDDEQARAIAAAAEGCGAERAQYYGRFIIEELIERDNGLNQVGESPDRGLDAQTPSGHEGDAAHLPLRRNPT
ncbi:MAG: hypothetical protein ABIQ29_01945 [Burkholderiaceae bacterium]